MPAAADGRVCCAGEENLARVTVVCAGNELARDDGIGIRVGRILQELELPGWVEVRLFQELGWDLLDTVRSSSRVIVVDATWSGRVPGTCTVGKLEATDAADRLLLGCHGFGLALLLDVARRLCPEASEPRVTLVGVEAERLDGFSTELSPSVREAFPNAVAAVLSELGVTNELVTRGKELARDVAAWEPALVEAHAG